MSTVESAQQVKAGIGAAVEAALVGLPDGGVVSVFWGEPPPSYPREFICIMGVQADLDVATMGPVRTRDEDVRVAVNFLASRQGSNAQQDSSARAYALASAVERQVRTVDPTLGGVCLWCFATRLDESGGTPAADRASGRYTEVVVEFTARVRLINN